MLNHLWSSVSVPHAGRENSGEVAVLQLRQQRMPQMILFGIRQLRPKPHKCRESGRIVNVAPVCATAVNREGQREILGINAVTREDGTAWTAFLRSLVARRLSGVELVISDAHLGLTDAIGAVLVGAAWQRCSTHFTRNLLTRVRRSAQPMVATLVRTVFAQPDAESTWAQLTRVVNRLEAVYWTDRRRKAAAAAATDDPVVVDIAALRSDTEHLVAQLARREGSQQRRARDAVRRAR